MKATPIIRGFDDKGKQVVTIATDPVEIDRLHEQIKYFIENANACGKKIIHRMIVELDV